MLYHGSKTGEVLLGSPHDALHLTSIHNINIYLYGTCVFRIIVHSTLFVRDAMIFTMHIGSCKPLLAQETRLEKLNIENERNRDVKAVRKGGHY